MYQSLFVSHGAPTLALSDAPANAFLRDLGGRLGRPDAIIVVSPHWMTDRHAVRAPSRFRTWHDFRGFPEELYRLRYEPPGDAALADRVRSVLVEAGLPAGPDAGVDLDHGAWVPLSLMFPAADIPIVQVSLRADAGPAGHLALGRALAPLAGAGVLILGSGSTVHNLGELYAEDAPAVTWASAFEDWLSARVLAGDHDALIDYRSLAPNAQRAHPEDDHLMPLFTSIGAGGVATQLHRSFTYGSIGMAAYGFAGD